MIHTIRYWFCCTYCYYISPLLYPLAPEHISIKEDMLSDYQRELAETYDVKIGGDKLCLTLHHKKKYKLHYRNLKWVQIT